MHSLEQLDPGEQAATAGVGNHLFFLARPDLTGSTPTFEHRPLGPHIRFGVLDNLAASVDNQAMTSHTTTLSVDETVKRFRQASQKVRKEIKGNPQKARDFLIRAGIARKSKTHPSGIELVPQLRPEA